MFEKNGLFPKKGRERKITEKEIKNAIEVIRSLAARVMRGEVKAPPLGLYESMQALMPQPAVEVVVTDGSGYYLHRRPANERHFGPNRLHLLGGFLKPSRRGMTMVETAKMMTEKEMGTKVEYLAGPIATYQWKRGIEHPTGWPNSQVYVFKAVNEVPKRDDIVRYSNDVLPAQDEMILARSGEIHLNFLRVYQDWVKNPNQPCRDLNERPFTTSDATSPQ